MRSKTTPKKTSDDSGSDSDSSVSESSSEGSPVPPRANEKCDNPSCKKSFARKFACSACGLAYHRDCSQSHKAAIDFLADPNWKCWSCKKCTICDELINDANHERSQYCQRCDKGFHKACIGAHAIKGILFTCEQCSKRRGAKKRSPSDSSTIKKETPVKYVPEDDEDSVETPSKNLRSRTPVKSPEKKKTPEKKTPQKKTPEKTKTEPKKQAKRKRSSSESSEEEEQPKEKKKKQTDPLNTWLEEKNLGEYYKAFKDQGYDDFEYLRECGLDDDDLDAMNVTKLGHRKRLQAIKEKK